MQAEEVSHIFSFVVNFIICLQLFSLSECKTLSYVSSMLKEIYYKEVGFPQLHGSSCSVYVHIHKDLLQEIILN